MIRICLCLLLCTFLGACSPSIEKSPRPKTYIISQPDTPSTKDTR